MCKYDWLVLVWILCVRVCDGARCLQPWAAASYIQLPATWERLRFTGSYWSEWVSPATGGSTFYPCVYILHRLSPWPSREEIWWTVGADCVCAECLWGMQIWIHLCINTCMFVCLCACREYAQSLHSWDLWCVSVAVSALPGCWVWHFPSSIFKALEMHVPYATNSAISVFRVRLWRLGEATLL